MFERNNSNDFSVPCLARKALQHPLCQSAQIKAQPSFQPARSLVIPAQAGIQRARLSTGPLFSSFSRRRESSACYWRPGDAAALLDSRLRGNDGKAIAAQPSGIRDPDLVIRALRCPSHSATACHRSPERRRASAMRSPRKKKDQRDSRAGLELLE
jgi:hypothetical protein